VELRLPTQESADLLDDYLRRCGCITSRVDAITVDASPPPRSIHDRLMRLELEAYLRVWRVMNEGIDLSVTA
jgi:hypothetical protein